MTGMEHVAHAAAILALTLLALRERPAHPVALAAMAALATGLRYESAFVAAALAVVLALRRDWRRGVALVAGSAVLVAGVGLWQVSLGEGFLPNSLLVKAAGVAPETASDWVKNKIYSAMEHAHESPVVALPLLAVIMALVAALRRTERAAGLPPPASVSLESAAALTLATLMHVVLARTGWYHRYEAYLLIWGVVAASGSFVAWHVRRLDAEQRVPAGRARPPAIIGALAAGALVLLAFGLRINAYNTAPKACRNIYEQHAQMARFVSGCCDGRPIVIHDIGYIAYLSDCPILDIAGLASHEIAVAKSHGQVDKAFVERRHSSNAWRATVARGSPSRTRMTGFRTPG